jgi:hypothetical protein
MSPSARDIQATTETLRGLLERDGRFEVTNRPELFI